MNSTLSSIEDISLNSSESGISSSTFKSILLVFHLISDFPDLMIATATKNKFSGVEIPSSPELGNLSTNLHIPSKHSLIHKKQLKLNIMKNLEIDSFPKDEIIMTPDKLQTHANIIHREFIILNEEKFSETFSQTNWQESRFKNLVFNPEGRSDRFCNHLIKTYEGLTHAKTFKEPPSLEAVARKSVELKRFSSKIIKFLKYNCFCTKALKKNAYCLSWMEFW